jgi:Flp pilus assembly protein TadG
VVLKMMKMPMFPCSRNRELGAVAILVAVMWTTLFGIAVLAVDFGYLYAKRRGVQAVADAALRSAMPIYAAGNGGSTAYSGAQTQSNLVAGGNGYVNGQNNTTIAYANDVANKRFTVTITRRYPTFLGGIFGLASKNVSGTATGEVSGSGNGAIYALGNNACPGSPTWGMGFYASGNSGLIVNGSIYSNTQVRLLGTPSLGGTVTGAVSSPCTPLTAPFNQAGMTIGSQDAVGATDPIAATIASLNTSCTFGTMYAPWGGGFGWVNTGGAGGCDTPVEGVYCSSTAITFAPVTSLSVCPGTRITLMSADRVIIGANSNITLAPATGAPNNIVIAAFSNMGAATCAGGAVDMGSAGTYTLTGNVYVPNGCIWFAGAGATGGFTMTGMMVGRHVSLGMAAGSTWTFNGTGSGSGGGWKLYR